MQLLLRYGLPFTTVTISYGGATIDIPDILVDTGSGSTILSADILGPIGITPLPEDTLSTIRGVGGNEVVFSGFTNFRSVQYKCFRSGSGRNGLRFQDQWHPGHGCPYANWCRHRLIGNENRICREGVNSRGRYTQPAAWSGRASNGARNSHMVSDLIGLRCPYQVSSPAAHAEH